MSAKSAVAHHSAARTAHASGQERRKLYLSGPMTGLPKSNFPAFRRNAERLRRRGFDVVNPADIDCGLPMPAEDSPEWARFYEACMRADIKAMMDCDGIAIMPGWERSSGAHLELHIAHRVGIEVRLLKDWLAGQCAGA